MLTTENSEGLTGSLESQRSRKLVDKLREHGLDKLVSLPQVAIMGDTSSGKSSVLSALSGITFPSSDTLTTRCPTQLIMTYAEQFSGSVTLRRFEAGADEKPVPTELCSMDDVPGVIEKITNQLVAENQHISDDSIVIQVSGPQLPNLTLIDLPGLVRTVGTNEDKSIIPRIRALVNRYLEQKRTIILAVVPANVDVHNTEILQAAEEADPYGDRTQAIITKLDLIDKGAEGAVVELLQNKIKVLKLGYHAVKCRGQNDLNQKVSIDEGIKNEKTFFKTSPIWSKVSSSLVGIGQLRSKLVCLLEEIIVRELPSVIEDLDKKQEEYETKLAGLGPAMDTSTSRRAYYSKITDSYHTLMKAAFDGHYNTSEFFQETDDENIDNRFRAIVSKKEEWFQIEVQNHLHKMEYVETSYRDIDPGDSVEVTSTTIKLKSWRARGTAGRRNTFDDDDDDDTETELNVLTSDGNVAFKVQNYKFGVRTLDKIKKMIASNRGDELSIFPSYNVFNSIVKTVIESWKKPMMKLFDNYKNTLKRISERAVHHSQCKDTVKRHLKSTISTILTSLEKQLLTILQNKLLSEQRPYTLNHYLYDIIIKLRNKPLLDAVEALDNPKGTKVPVSTFLGILKRHGVGLSSNEDNVAVETEMAVIAYLKVASKRFIDEIPRLLNDNLLGPFLREIKGRLCVATDDMLFKMLAEDYATSAQRKHLEEAEKSLMASKEEISLFLERDFKF